MMAAPWLLPRLSIGIGGKFGRYTGLFAVADAALRFAHSLILLKE